MTNEEKKTLNEMREMIRELSNAVQSHRNAVDARIEKIEQNVERQPINLEYSIADSIRANIREAIDRTLVGYNSPIIKLIEEHLKRHMNQYRQMLDSVFTANFDDVDLQEEIKKAYVHKVSRALISGLDGSIQKSVNVLKNDEVLRSKILVQIDEIVNKKLRG